MLPVQNGEARKRREGIRSTLNGMNVANARFRALSPARNLNSFERRTRASKPITGRSLYHDILLSTEGDIPGHTTSETLDLQAHIQLATLYIHDIEEEQCSTAMLTFGHPTRSKAQSPEAHHISPETNATMVTRPNLCKSASPLRASSCTRSGARQRCSNPPTNANFGAR
jgi:hypothetical protein